MKKIQVAVPVLVFLFCFSAQAVTVVECSQDAEKVTLSLIRKDTGSLSINGQELYDVGLDPYSAKASKDLYLPLPADLAAVQDHYNSVVVLRVPHNVMEKDKGETFKASLEYRDYDSDYDKNEYKGKDKGPGENKYVLRPGSLTKLRCALAN